MKNLMMNFQNPTNNNMNNITSMNDMLMIMMMMLMMSILYPTMKNLKSKKTILIQENNNLELLWTITPSFILLSMSLPSILILYSTEENMKSIMSIKIMANQWFWMYEYPQMKNMNFNSFMKKNPIRCISTSNPLMIPSKTPTSLLITSNDVIHSFSMNSNGLKMDAIPGRINMVKMETEMSGLSTGQCSEICGMNHSFMPIFVNSLNMKMMNM